MMPRRCLVMLACWVTLLGSSVSAQRLEDGVGASGSKSPALAGTLSLVLPGTGSLYAGHTGHGIRHLVAIPLILAVTYACVAIADQEFGGDLTAEKAYCVLGGLALYVVNDVWSVVTAVQDAKRRTLAVSLRWSPDY